MGQPQASRAGRGGCLEKLARTIGAPSRAVNLAIAPAARGVAGAESLSKMKNSYIESMN
jgi:hypothetical protein